jgi:endonuclease YncB( thermonuclease family)
MFPLIKKTAVIGIVFFAFVSFWPALKSDHSGPATVIDADTIEIAGEKHRLYGLDAVELAQSCRRRDGVQWPCGQAAAAALARFLEGRTVTCEVWQKTKRDAYGRFISVCYAGGDEINAWVVKHGWAVADRDANRLYNYTSDEGMAKFLRRGLWVGEFDRPEDWRHAHQ